MKYLDGIIEEIKSELSDAPFHDYIREARDRIGMKQYRAAEFVGITLGRLRNMESGYFRNMPEAQELKGFAKVFDLDYDILREKAEEHVDRRKKDRKVRIIEDGSSAVPHMQAN